MASVSSSKGGVEQARKTCLVVSSGAEGGDLGRVADARLEPMRSEGAKHHGGGAVQGADAPVGRGCAAGAAHDDAGGWWVVVLVVLVVMVLSVFWSVFLLVCWTPTVERWG